MSDLTNTAAPAALPCLDDLVPADTATLAILNVARQPIGWNIVLAGPTHPVTLALADEVMQEGLNRQHDIATAQIAGKAYTVPAETAEQVRKRTSARVAKRILGWNDVTIGGEVLSYSPSNALRLTGEPKFRRIYDQIVEYLGGEKAFTTSSAPT